MIYILLKLVIMKNVYSTGNFLGKTNSPNITVVDTPGFKVNFYKFSAKVFFNLNIFIFIFFKPKYFHLFPT